MIKQTDNSDIRKTLRMKRFFFDSSRQKTFQDIFKCSWLNRASLNSLGGSTIEKQQLWSRYSSFPNGSWYIYFQLICLLRGSFLSSLNELGWISPIIHCIHFEGIKTYKAPIYVLCNLCSIRWINWNQIHKTKN